MSSKSNTAWGTDQNGAGLVVAVFVIVIMGMFGTLIVRYAATGASMATDEYLWAQAMYAAESAAQLRILYHDRGNTGGPAFPLTVEGFSIPTPIIDTFDLNDRNKPASLKLKATRIGVSREIELKYKL